MKNEHIIALLDQSAFDDLSQRDLTIIKNHVFDCENCRRAYQAAKVSAVLLKTRVAEICQPTPFLEIRIMAAWREKQNASIAAFGRWWQASSAVVAAMIMIVAVLLAVTLAVPNDSSSASRRIAGQTSLFEEYSTEKVIFNETDLNAQLTTNQALQIIYDQQKPR